MQFNKRVNGMAEVFILSVTFCEVPGYFNIYIIIFFFDIQRSHQIITK